jgi:hypothetical protein
VPDELVLVDRADGGALVVLPPREVWDRSELSSVELCSWSLLVAATAKAMLEALPQLQSGCINYWEAGNWSLNDQASPVGFKSPRDHRRVHLHLLGRCPLATSSSWKWGEAPRFPDFADRHIWAADHKRLNPDECRSIVSLLESILRETYNFQTDQIKPWSICLSCGYPVPTEETQASAFCSECSI